MEIKEKMKRHTESIWTHMLRAVINEMKERKEGKKKSQAQSMC